MRVFRNAIVWLLLAPASAAAQSPAALVTDVSGDVAPQVELFQELAAGTEITLAPGASLTLEHYASCESVTVSGGTLTVGADALKLDRAVVAERGKADCVTPVALAAQDTVSAAVIMRSADVALPKIALAPTIFVAGGDGGPFDGLSIERDGHEIARLDIRDGRVDWPAGEFFLSDRTRYVLVLEGKDGPHRTEVVADRDGPARVLLRP